MEKQTPYYWGEKKINKTKRAHARRGKIFSSFQQKRHKEEILNLVKANLEKKVFE